MIKQKDTKAPEYTPLVNLPKQDIVTYGRGAYKAACRGEDGVAILLNYFVFEATREANKEENKKKAANLGAIECVTIKRNEEEIKVKGLNNSVSKPTLIAYRRKLEKYGFIVARPYRQEYDVYIKKIREAIENPPEPEKKKPRGKHAPKSLNSLNHESKGFKEETEEVKVKNLTFESKKFNSQSKKINFLESRVEALEAALAKAMERIDYLDSNYRLLLSSKEDSAKSAPSSANEETSSKIVSLQDKQAKRAKASKQKETPAQDEVVFTPEENGAYDLYCTLYYVKAKPKRSAKVKDQCATLAPYVKTPDDIKSLDKYARENTPGKPKVLYLGNMVAQLNGWLQDKAPAPATTSKQSTQTTLFEQPAESSAPELVYWHLSGRHLSHDWLGWGYMPREQAEKLGFIPDLTKVPREVSMILEPKKLEKVKEAGLLDLYNKLTPEERMKPLTDWVKQHTTVTATA